MDRFQAERRRILTMAGVAMLAPVLRARGDTDSPVLKGSAMGGSYRVVLGNNPHHAPLAKIRRHIHNQLEISDILMSPYRQDSELMRFNRNHSEDWQMLSPLTSRVLGAALEVERQSQGAFNPGIGNLVDQWGFGAESSVTGLVSTDSVGDSNAFPLAHQLIECRGELARKRHPAAALNLNAIAKGEAVDRIGSTLGALGVTNYLVEVGGEVLARGRGLKGDGWWIGIEGPSGDSTQCSGASSISSLKWSG